MLTALLPNGTYYRVRGPHTDGHLPPSSLTCTPVLHIKTACLTGLFGLSYCRVRSAYKYMYVLLVCVVLIPMGCVFCGLAFLPRPNLMATTPAMLPWLAVSRFFLSAFGTGATCHGQPLDCSAVLVFSHPLPDKAASSATSRRHGLVLSVCCQCAYHLALRRALHIPYADPAAQLLPSIGLQDIRRKAPGEFLDTGFIPKHVPNFKSAAIPAVGDSLRRVLPWPEACLSMSPNNLSSGESYS